MLAKVTYKDIWLIAYPIMLGSIAQTFLGITDTAFLARVGEIELGASAIGGVFYFVLIMVGMGLGIGAQIIMARKAGENDPAAIGKVFDHTMILLLFLSAIVFTGISVFGNGLFRWLIQSPAVLLDAGIYLKYRIWGIFFVMIAVAFRAFYVGIAQTRIITYSALVMTVCNIALDYLLIFGHYGFPKMGIGGAAVASVISEAIAAVYLLVYTLFKRDIKKFRLFKFKKLSQDIFQGIINLSTPIVMQNIISMGAWFAFFVFIERLGEHELAISNIIRSNYMILMTPIWGYSSASNSMVSNLIGQKKPEMVISLLKKISTLSLCTAFILVFFNVVFANRLLHITASSEQLVNEARNSFYMVCFATLIFSISMILFSAVSGTGATRAAMCLEISNIIIYLSFVYICAVIIKTPVEIVWFAEVLYWLLMGTFSWLYLKSKRWKIISI